MIGPVSWLKRRVLRSFGGVWSVPSPPAVRFGEIWLSSRWPIRCMNQMTSTARFATIIAVEACNDRSRDSGV